jgi:hypothetical protein
VLQDASGLINASISSKVGVAAEVIENLFNPVPCPMYLFHFVAPEFYLPSSLLLY